MTEETNNHDGRSSVGVEIAPVPGISAVKKNKARDMGGGVLHSGVKEGSSEKVTLGLGGRKVARYADVLGKKTPGRRH